MNPTLGPAAGPLAADVVSAYPFAIPACVIGGALCVAGAWIVRGARADPPAPVARWHTRLSNASRTVLGLSTMLLGYHAASWASPEQWLPFRVPVERWYLLAVGIAVAVGGTLWADRRQNEPPRT